MGIPQLNIFDQSIDTLIEKDKLASILRTPTAPHERVSEIYKFVDTLHVASSIIAAAKAAGLENFRLLNAAGTKSEGNKGVHFVTFATGIFFRGGELTVTMRNSCDGLSSFLLWVGALVLLCKNGLRGCVAIVEPERIVHKGLTYEKLTAALKASFEKMYAFGTYLEKLQSINLTPEQHSEFLKKALEIRGLSDVSPEYTTIDKARRVEDLGTSAWAVLNRVQENLTKGFTTVQGGKVKQIQALRSPKSDFLMNVNLMDAIHKIVA